MIEAAEFATYNLGAVLQETGLNPDTLRAWERRYGLPQPQRSEGGHRLYTQRDIEIVKWLMARQAEKLSISQAVKLWQSLEAEGEDPLRLAAKQAAVIDVGEPGMQSTGLLTDVRQAWVAACKQFNEREADAILAQAFALFTTETVCMEVLMGGLAELGSGWYDGDVIVQQEHFATQLAKRRLEALIQATPPPTRADRILVAAPAGEDHDLVLLLLVLLLRRRSLDVIDLGANVPARHLVSVVANTKSDMVITAAQRLHTAASLQQMAQALLAQQIPLLYGGRIFNLIPELRKRIAGHFIGERLEEVTQVVEAHLAKPRPASPAELASEAYQRARIQFQAQLPLIEGDVLTTLGEGIVEEHLMTANLHMAQDIDAALSLGDMGLMGSEIEWLEGLLDNHQMPREQLERYLAAYRQAAHRNLDETGRPVTEWLEQISQPTR